MSKRVILTHDEHAMLVSKAAAWDSVSAYAERLNFRRTSSAISAAEDWRAVADRPSYAELERRRGRAVPPMTCDWKLCGAPGTPHRSLVTKASIVLCPAHSHLAVPESVPARTGVAA